MTNIALMIGLLLLGAIVGIAVFILVMALLCKV